MNIVICKIVFFLITPLFEEEMKDKFRVRLDLKLICICSIENHVMKYIVKI